MRLRPYLLLVLLLTASCAKPPAALTSSDAEQQKVQALTERILQLPGDGDRREASRIAAAAVRKAAAMHEEFHVTTSPRLHNLMINLGLRERGLCYQWADDLKKELTRLNPKHYEFHAAVAHRGSIFLEHSSVVITTKGEPFQSGLVLDAWRNSGDLFWVRVGNDKYEWQPWDTDSTAFQREK